MKFGPLKFNVRHHPEEIRILVPVNGKPASDHAFRWACQLARRYRARLYAVYVYEVPLTLPMESELVSELREGEEILTRMEKIAIAEHYPVNAGLLEARRAGPAIVLDAEERRVDLLVVGLPWQRSGGSARLGETADYILKNAPCQVLFSREPSPVAVRLRE